MEKEFIIDEKAYKVFEVPLKTRYFGITLCENILRLHNIQNHKKIRFTTNTEAATTLWRSYERIISIVCNEILKMNKSSSSRSHNSLNFESKLYLCVLEWREKNVFLLYEISMLFTLS